jgi:hypothetical protein
MRYLTNGQTSGQCAEDYDAAPVLLGEELELEMIEEQYRAHRAAMAEVEGRTAAEMEQAA